LNHDKNESIALILSGSYHDQKSNYATNIYNVYESNVNGSLLYEKDFSAMHKLSTGVSFNWDQYNQRIDINRLNMGEQPTKESVTGAYAQYTFSLNNKLIILAGLRADYSSLHDAFVTPRLHIKYDLLEGYHLRFSIGKGYRSVFVLPENSFLLASSRTLRIDNNLKQEEALNYGISANFHIPLFKEELALALEFFRTDFQNQVVIDMDSNPNETHLYNLNGKSYSNSFQAEASYPLFRGFTLLAAYRWNNTKTNYNGKMMKKPLLSDYKALVTASYETKLRKWQFDLTAQFNGGGRMPTPAKDINGVPLWNDTFKPFTILNGQITKFFRNWSVYVGGENLLNFTQKNPIIGANDPFGKDFDATMVYGPTQGAKFYLGARFNISK
jgi:outer membrane receptor for ferrienterochelin and colicin